MLLVSFTNLIEEVFIPVVPETIMRLGYIAKFCN